MSVGAGTRTRLLFAAVTLGLAIPQGVQAAGGSLSSPLRLRLPGWSLALRPRLAAAEATTGRAGTELVVTLTNTSSRPASVSTSDFALSADGDMFGVRGWSAGTARVRIEPHRSGAIRLSFTPQAGISQAALMYRPAGQSTAGVLPLTGSRAFVASEGISTFSLRNRAADPWGLAVDKHDDVWFAAPGCDFEPICGAGTPPGKIGELKARSHRMVLHTLPNIPGNQPSFLTFDPQGNLWFTTPDNGKIGEFSPSRGRFVGQWSVTPGSGPWDLTFSHGVIWYTEHLVSAVGSFSPHSHRHRDFPTPSANSNPYGIAAAGDLIWFTENNSSVDRVAAINTRNDAISEYPIVQPMSGTPHLIAIGPYGHPWWTEGFSNTIATLNPSVAEPGSCAVTGSGTCRGVRRFLLPPPAPSCAADGTHVSGIGIERRPHLLVWFDDSLSGEVGFFSPRTGTFDLDTLSGCDAHPHDGLALDSRNDVWFGEEFGEAIGEWRR